MVGQFRAICLASTLVLSGSNGVLMAQSIKRARPGSNDLALISNNNVHETGFHASESHAPVSLLMLEGYFAGDQSGDRDFAAYAGYASPPSPRPTPTPDPAQIDATRPPGTRQDQTVPPGARPVTQDPTAPPGTTKPDPQAPPGTTVAPAPTPVTVPSPLPVQPEEDVEPTFPPYEQLPVPPLPDLSRVGVISDNTVTLSLRDAIRRALESNNDIEVARNDVRFAEATLRSFEGVYDPFLNLFPQVNNTVESQQSTLGGSDEQGALTRTDMLVNSSVTKFFSDGGGRYDFFFNNNRRTTNSAFNRLNPVYSASLGVQFTQPLWRNFSIDNNRRQIRIQRKRLEQSDAEFRRRTIDVISQVQIAYWDLVFALRDQQNRILNLNLARENFRRIEAQIAAGAAPPFARAEVQTELSSRESEVLLAAQNVTIAENNLKQLILGDPLAPEWFAQLTPMDTPSFDTSPISLDAAMKDAAANRPELRRLRLQRDINAIDLKYFRNQTRPQIDIQSTFATTGLSGNPVIPTGTITGGIAAPGSPAAQVPLISGNPQTNASAFLLDQINQLRTLQGLGSAVVPTIDSQVSVVPQRLIGGYGQTLRNLFSFDTRTVVFGVAIQIPLRNKTAEGNLAGARIQRDQLEASMRLQEQTVVVEVRNAVQSVETSRQRVFTARAARESAELQLEGERRLYQVGRSTTFLLFQRENQLANARNLELRAEIDYNKALASLQRATSTTLSVNGVVVESPTGGN